MISEMRRRYSFRPRRAPLQWVKTSISAPVGHHVDNLPLHAVAEFEHLMELAAEFFSGRAGHVIDGAVAFRAFTLDIVPIQRMRNLLHAEQ